MTKSGRAERSKTLFAHAVLASIREEQLVQKHFDTEDDRPNLSEFDPLSNTMFRMDEFER